MLTVITAHSFRMVPISWRFSRKDKDKTPVMVASTKDGKYVVVAGNFNDEPRSMSVKIGNKYLDVTLPPHSLHTFAEK